MYYVEIELKGEDAGFELHLFESREERDAFIMELPEYTDFDFGTYENVTIYENASGRRVTYGE